MVGEILRKIYEIVREINDDLKSFAILHNLLDKT